MKNILITGAAGFIGFHLKNKLDESYTVHGIDWIDEKNVAAQKRAEKLQDIKRISIHSEFLNAVETPDLIVHLAAETGISASLTNPQIYFQQNVAGTFNVLEQCRKKGVKYLIYASSSSVYSSNQSVMHENAGHDKQLSFYGTSKRLTEIMIENHCRQFGITAVGLRFFTVYGSWTRPDMAAYKFMNAISNEQPVTLYNNGDVWRDFTHVSDVVQAIALLIPKIQEEKEGTHQVFNIGYGSPVSVSDYARLISGSLGKKLTVRYTDLPANELFATHADTSKLEAYIHFKPQCSVQQGVAEMTDWFKKSRYE